MLRLDLGRRVASGLGSGIVPGLHIGATEDDEEAVAHQVNRGGNEEDHTPLFHIVLQVKVDRILTFLINQLLRAQLTSLVTMKPTKSGAMILMMLPTQLVMPIRVPAKLGDRSMWFSWNPR